MSEATSAILEVDFQQAKYTGNEEVSCHGYFFNHEKPKQGAGCPNDTPTSQGYLGDKKNDEQDITIVGYLDAYMGMLKSEDDTETAKADAPDIVFLEKILPKIMEEHPNITDVYLVESGKRINSVWRKAIDGEAKKVTDGMTGILQFIKDKAIALVPVQKELSKKATKNVLLASSMVRDTDKFLCKFSEGKGYWTNKVEVNRLLASSRWYYATDGRTAEKVGDHVVYHMGAPSKDDELVGKPESDSHYSVVFLKEPDPTMEFIRKHQLLAARKAQKVGVAIARLDTIISSGNYSLMDEYGEQAINSTATGNIVLGEAVLSKVLHPPMLTWRAADATQDLENVLKCFVDGDLSKDYTVTEITDSLYFQEEGKKKTVTKLNTDIGTGTKAIPVTINFDIGTCAGGYNTKILLGVDLPRRNTLSALAEKEPKVYILSWKYSDIAIKFLTIIEVDGEYGAWSGYYSNMRLVIKK